MKLASILLAAAFAVAYAEDTGAGTVTAAGGSAASETPKPATAVGEATSATNTPAAAGSAEDAASTTTTVGGGATDSALSALKATKQPGWHMKPIRAVHARVQSDTPKYFETFYGSQFGKDAKGAYLSSLDTVNTASVEGALMYVQAEGINQNSRSAEDRCTRKNKMRNIVFYEVMIAQTNETIAQYQDSWNAPEYGPFLAMDSGACTAQGDSTPPECLMFNGVDGYPNVGPFVGAGIKLDDPRAPYPDNYWFSFPNTCPQKVWAEKTDECRSSTRMGLCPVGVAPDGVTCTFAYDILGWVTIDDVVGITNESYAGGKYANFTEWCEATEKNIEFAGDVQTGAMEEGLDFWKDPTDKEANAARAKKVVEVYNAMVAGKFESTMVPATDVARFKPLPSPEELAAQNPKCYESVKSCATEGCKRTLYSQLCTKCESGEKCDLPDSSFTFPTLEKAPTTKSDEELSSGSALGGSSGTVGGKGSKTPAPSAASAAQLAVASVAAAAVAVLAL
ncbi:hypothetical protein Poli38472_014484 [Pythium oligandrum]|uniref:Uncharacterized protein n=1 Tax=Pythium oligandrum TaxID=41045 RepID=A0A8K1CDJ3_PYTOL|nr:hypothetical protein Poli38472_014484 [Pythium oligandrum]|eukprot:TMW61023.1 hypothetical protein Poli38472_014484 [Pythium oligandrum]